MLFADFQPKFCGKNLLYRRNFFEKIIFSGRHRHPKATMNKIYVVIHDASSGLCGSFSPCQKLKMGNFRDISVEGINNEKETGQRHRHRHHHRCHFGPHPCLHLNHAKVIYESGNWSSLTFSCLLAS